MKKGLILFTLLFFCAASLKANDSTAQVKSISAIILNSTKNKTSVQLSLNKTQHYFAIVFLSPECPICQSYTSTLNSLFQKYNKEIAFYGIIPGKSFNAKTVNKFKKDYKVVFPLAFDHFFKLTQLLKATTTPQVFLIDARNNILYSGLIDNWAEKLGIKRTIITEHYLNDAIIASLQNQIPKKSKTKPSGCLITDY